MFTLKTFYNNINIEISLKTLHLKAIDKWCLNELKNSYNGYLSVTTMDLIYHLIDRYGKIIPVYINWNKDWVEENINTSQPINVYSKRI